MHALTETAWQPPDLCPIVPHSPRPAPWPPQVPGVEEVHDLHVWSLTPGIPLLCAHVNLAPDADPTAVLHALTTYCRGIGVDHSTIQLVSDGSACPCDPC